MLGHRERIVALSLAVPAGHACKSMGDVGELDIDRRGSRMSSRLPLSMRCQALVLLLLRAIVDPEARS